MENPTQEFTQSTSSQKHLKLPLKSKDRTQVLQHMTELQKTGANWHDGRTFSLVYHAGDEHTEFLKKAYDLYFHENGLNPGAFPSIKKYEAEVVSMVCDLFHGATAAGTMTSGGSESIMMAVKTYRDYYASLGKTAQPEMILPRTIHPAFCKAAQYFKVKPIYVPVDQQFRADVAATEKAITPNTILIVGSAPAYPHGCMDPIEDLARLAQKHSISMHVDACVGGMSLPFLKKLGHAIPAFDFSIPGVTSISADLHKYGFTAKGASVIVYRSAELRRHQFFITQDWPGGLFASPSMTGTRPAGSIAAAWATFQALGEEGYLKLHQEIMTTAQKFKQGIQELGFKILGNPEMSVFAFTSPEPKEVNIYVVADLMEKKGWHVDRQLAPECIHLMITPAHTASVLHYLADLKEARDYSRAHPELATEGMAALYGMVAQIPDPTMIQQFLYNYMDERYLP